MNRSSDEKEAHSLVHVLCSWAAEASDPVVVSPVPAPSSSGAQWAPAGAWGPEAPADADERNRCVMSSRSVKPITSIQLSTKANHNPGCYCALVLIGTFYWVLPLGILYFLEKTLVPSCAPVTELHVVVKAARVASETLRWEAVAAPAACVWVPEAPAPAAARDTCRPPQDSHPHADPLGWPRGGFSRAELNLVQLQKKHNVWRVFNMFISCSFIEC